MELWIGVAVVGGIALLAGLLDAVRRFYRGEIRPLELALLLVAIFVPVSLAVALLLTGHDTSGYAELALWPVVAVALWVESSRRRREHLRIRRE